MGTLYDVQTDENFCAYYTSPIPGILSSFSAFKIVIAPVFLRFLIIRSQSVLEHFDVSVMHVGLGNFRF